MYGEYLSIKKNYEQIQKWAENESENYWKERLPYEKLKLERVEKEVEKAAEKYAQKGVNINDFKHQQEQTELKIAAIDKIINEELPIIREKLVAQYKQEKQERLNAPQIDFVKERAEENKTFFKLRPTAEKSESKVAENKVSQDEEQRTYKAFKR